MPQKKTFQGTPQTLFKLTLWKFAIIISEWRSYLFSKILLSYSLFWFLRLFVIKELSNRAKQWNLLISSVKMQSRAFFHDLCKELMKKETVTTITVKNTVISPYFLVWKFYGKAQFPHSFVTMARNYAETVPFHKISTPGNQVKLLDFSQWKVIKSNHLIFQQNRSIKKLIFSL